MRWNINALLLAFAVMLALLIWHGDSSKGQSGVTSVPTAMDGEPGSTQPVLPPAPQTRDRTEQGTPDDAAQGSQKTCVVRSELGTPIRKVHIVWDGSEEETEHLLGPGGTLRLSASGPFSIWSSGHLAQRIESKEKEEIVLAPEFGLVIQSDGIHPLLRALSLNDVPVQEFAELGDAVCVGRIDEDSLSLAIEWNRYATLASQLPQPELSFSGLNGVHYSCRPKPGTQGIHSLALDMQQASVVAVGLAVDCPNDAANDCTIDVWGVSPSLPGVTPDMHLPWGDVRVTKNWGGAERLDGRLATFVAGRSYGIRVICNQCGAYGREMVAPDAGGDRIEIFLREGVRIIGSAACPSDRLYARWKFAWEEGSPVDGANRTWNGDGFLPLDADGRFELKLPGTVPMRTEDTTWPMPPVVLVSFKALDETRELWVELTGTSEVDVGDLGFTAREPELVLSPWTEFKEAQGVRFKMGESTRSFNVESHQRPDGAVDLFIKGFALSPEDRPEDIIVIADLQGYGYERRGEVYFPVPAREIKVVVDCDRMPDRVDRVYVGWTWRGTDHKIARVDSSYVGVEIPWTIAHPEEADILWWSEGSHRPQGQDRGRSTPLTIDTSRISIP